MACLVAGRREGRVQVGQHSVLRSARVRDLVFVGLRKAEVGHTGEGWGQISTTNLAQHCRGTLEDFAPS
eukprot:32982-Chlamydomonas_euryale.AAC.1